MKIDYKKYHIITLSHIGGNVLTGHQRKRFSIV